MAQDVGSPPSSLCWQAASAAVIDGIGVAPSGRISFDDDLDDADGSDTVIKGTVSVTK